MVEYRIGEQGVRGAHETIKPLASRCLPVPGLIALAPCALVPEAPHSRLGELESTPTKESAMALVRVCDPSGNAVEKYARPFDVGRDLERIHRASGEGEETERDARRASEIVDWVAGEPWCYCFRQRCVHFATQGLGNGSDSEGDSEVRTLLIICRARDS
jgi:hypothetical protein